MTTIDDDDDDDEPTPPDAVVNAGKGWSCSDCGYSTVSRYLHPDGDRWLVTLSHEATCPALMAHRRTGNVPLVVRLRQEADDLVSAVMHADDEQLDRLTAALDQLTGHAVLDPLFFMVSRTVRERRARGS